MWVFVANIVGLMVGWYCGGKAMQAIHEASFEEGVVRQQRTPAWHGGWDEGYRRGLQDGAQQAYDLALEEMNDRRSRCYLN